MGQAFKVNSESSFSLAPFCFSSDITPIFGKQCAVVMDKLSKIDLKVKAIIVKPIKKKGKFRLHLELTCFFLILSQNYQNLQYRRMMYRPLSISSFIRIFC
jgi:hypothetical protein